MDYSKYWPNLDDSQTAMMEQVYQFATNVVAPRAKHNDATGEFPTETIKQMAEMGLMGMMVDEKWGGAGLDTVTYAMSMEAISAACASTGVIMSVNNSLVCYPISAYGNDAQKEKFLRPLATGQKLGCFALSEPGHGSDPAGLKCRAEKVSGGYKINGSKNWITNGREADYCILFATINPELKHKGICAFVVDTKTKGYSVNKLEDKLGITASSTASLFFDDVIVPEECLLGKEGDGFKIAMSTLDGGRIGIASQALGIGQSSIDECKKFAMEREQFGAPIAKLQAIQFYIAEMRTRMQGARLLTWHAAVLKDKGQPFSQEAAMAKLSAAENCMWTATKGIQVHGGYGFTKEYAVERNFRDAKITEIYEGTSEIQKLVIAAGELRAK